MRAWWASGVAGLAALPQAGAQQPPAGEQGALPSVYVTAQRRSEPLQEVPFNVSVLRGEALDVLAASGRDLRYLASRLPSLNIESDFGRSFPRFYLRGLGNTDFDLNAAQPVGVVLDDVVQESPLLKSFPLFDLQQVEVLRGPQGSLFGRNAPAGVVKFDSARPVFRREGYASAGIGKDRLRTADGAFNMPLGDTLALRVSLLSQHRGNRVFNDRPNPPTTEFEGYHDNAARVQLLYQPGPAFSAAERAWPAHGGTGHAVPREHPAKGQQRPGDGFRLRQAADRRHEPPVPEDQRRQPATALAARWLQPARHFRLGARAFF